MVDSALSSSEQPKPKRLRLYATRESAERGEVSLLALLETVLAMSVAVGLSVWFDSVKWLAGACALAPLLLLRTEDSVSRALGWVARIDPNEKWFYWASIACGFCALALCIWFTDWWALLITAGFGGALLASSIALLTFYVRFGATAVSLLKHPVQSVLAIPENWRRVVLATDSAVPPVFIPGSDSGPQFFLSELEKGNYVRKWILLTLFFGFYPLTAAYRWSVKTTCLVYLPIVWIVDTAKHTPGSVRFMLKDFLKDDIQRLRRVLGVAAILCLSLKVALLLHINAAVMWMKERLPGWVLTIIREWNHYIVPREIPLSQIAPALNGALAAGLWVYARRVLRLKESTPSEGTVLAVWRTLTTLSLILSLYTIACAAIITRRAGNLTETLQRLWELTGRRLLP